MQRKRKQERKPSSQVRRLQFAYSKIISEVKILKVGEITQMFGGKNDLASVAQLDVPSDWRPGGRGFNPRRGR